ncbi:MAG: hypothetical protein GY803_16725 [Chloroflexi bacterium]|nr:hypothetical protein [Chloroflexota bacterium]
MNGRVLTETELNLRPNAQRLNSWQAASHRIQKITRHSPGLFSSMKLGRRLTLMTLIFSFICVYLACICVQNLAVGQN